MRFTIDGLKAENFAGFIPILNLKKSNCEKAPELSGIYVVLCPFETITFLDKSPAGHFNGDPTEEVNILNDKWMPSAQVIYIGKAGGNDSRATLKSRIKQYMKFGQGESVGHWGGRYIWQIKEVDECLVVWKIIEKDNPSDVETELINDFCQQYGKLPFANHKGGKKD